MKDTIHPKMYMYRRIVEAKLYIDQHFAQKIDLENISNEACFSKYHFLRLFKQAYGVSPHKYLTEVRIREARKLLRKGQPVTQVCFAVGFESLPSFTNLFRRTVGMSPSHYSQQCAKEHERQASQPLRFVPHCYAYNLGWTK